MIRPAITLASAFLSVTVLAGAQQPGSNGAGGGSSSVVPGGSANGRQAGVPWNSGSANPTGADSARRHTDSRNGLRLPQSNKDRGNAAYRPRNWAGSYGFSDYGYFSPYPDPSPDQEDAGYPTGYGPYETTESRPAARDESGTGDGTSAQITIVAPAGTEIWIDDAKVANSAGPMYTFATPPLERSRRYGYTIKARWLDHQQSVTQSEQVVFGAGTGVMVRFPKAAEPGK